MFKHKKLLLLSLTVVLVLLLALPSLGFMGFGKKKPQINPGNPLKPLTPEQQVQRTLAHMQRAAQLGHESIFMRFFTDDFADANNPGKNSLRQSFSEFATIEKKEGFPRFLIMNPDITVEDNQATVSCKLIFSGEINGNKFTNKVPETFVLERSERGWKIKTTERLIESLRNPTSLVRSNTTISTERKGVRKK